MNGMADALAAAPTRTPLQDEWVARVLDIRVGGRAAGRRKPAGPPPPEPTGLALWQRTRSEALTSLKALEHVIRATDDPDRDEAIILLRAVQANLREVPATMQQVDELQKYIDADDVVAAAEQPNDFGVTVDLTGPLRLALASLRAELEASGG
jgi:hypothetical protein